MDTLARELDVSRGTVANALRRLADEERVVVLRGYGTYARLAAYGRASCLFDSA
jgi:DNA-binding GntR family transcriptional regulator